MLKTILSYLSAFAELIFPQLCVSCSHHHPVKGDVMCLYCKAQVSESRDHLMAENAFTKHFWGRVNIQTGSSLYYYSKGGKVQTAIQNLKYKNKKEIGKTFGHAFGIKEQMVHN